MEKFKEVDVDRNLLLHHPFTMVCAGATGSGKTQIVRELLENYDKITSLNRPIRVAWCYGILQPIYDEPLANEGVRVEYIPGMPESDIQADVIVLDDLQSTAGNDKRLADMFTRYSHHRNVSIVLILQNIFHQAKSMRSVTLNSHYLLLLASRRDRGQIAKLASQIYPGETDFLLSAYKDALSRDFGYLLIDLSPKTQEEFRLRTNFIPTDYPIIVYQKTNDAF